MHRPLLSLALFVSLLPAQGVVVRRRVVATGGGSSISYINGAAFTSGNANSVSFSVSYSPAAGRQLAICVVNSNVGAADTVASVHDQNNNAATFVAGVTRNGTVRAELWQMTAVPGATSFTATLTTQIHNSVGIAVEEYSNMVHVGTNATNSGTGTAPTVSRSTQDTNNVVTACMGVRSGVVVTANVGNLRHSSYNTGTDYITLAVTDNTSGSPATVVNTVGTTDGSDQWAAVAMELRTQ